MLLRDIVDLEATYDMSDISDNKLEDTLKLIESSSDEKKIKIKKVKNLKQRIISENTQNQRRR